MSKIKSKIIVANAGSGKTYSIVQHIKEIIASGASHSSILCITFTNAGRDEMQERLLKDIPTLETLPKIVTFHSLCNEIVNSFTHELSMPYGFELDESDEVQSKVESELLKLDSIQKFITDFRISPSKFSDISSSLYYNYHKIHTNAEYRSAVLKEIFQPDEQTIEEITAEILHNIPIEMLQSVGGKKMEEALPKILDIISKYESPSANSTNSIGDFMEFCKIAGSSSVQKNEEYIEYKTHLKERVDDVHNIITFQKCTAIGLILDDVISTIEQVKRNLRKYTFSDLIHKTLVILENPELRDFAIFKFGSIFSHILVDEAQDTNEHQWQILSHFIEEQIAGGMAGGSDGSLFIVGDTKQTIYSFQGAKANIMGDIHGKYSEFLEQHFLTTSFRTTQPVLDVINNMPHLNNERHISNFKNNAGFVKILNITKKVEKEEVEEEILMAQKTLEIVQSLIGKRISHEKYNNKILEPSDFAILVKDRKTKVISALKEAFFNAHIPISFNEKVDFSQSFCVLDFIAVLKLCIIESDSISLYGLLKSSMFKLDETSFEHQFNRTSAPNIEDFPQLNTCIVKFREVLNHDGLYVFFKQLFSEFEQSYSTVEQSIIESFIQTTQTLDQFNPIDFIQKFESSTVRAVMKNIIPNSIVCTTAHASKGMEFPIVIYLEKRGGNKPNNSVLIQNGVALSISTKEERGSRLQKFLDEHKKVEEEENMRLYYVVISRAAFGFYCISSYVSPKKDAKNDDEDGSFFNILEQSLSNLECTKSHDETFAEISYSKREDAEQVSQLEIKAVAVDLKVQDVVNSVENSQTQGEKFGTFIHKLFEDSGKDLAIEQYFQFYDLSADFPKLFEDSTAKVQKVNDVLYEKFHPHKILREHEIIHNGKVLRIDALYFGENEITVIDYKTQEPIMMQEIKDQLDEYVVAVRGAYGVPTNSFVLWWQKTELEELY